MSGYLADLTVDELFWLATKISRAESYARALYVVDGDRRYSELFEELLKVRLDAEYAHERLPRAAQRKRKRTPRARLHS